MCPTSWVIAIVQQQRPTYLSKNTSDPVLVCLSSDTHHVTVRRVKAPPQKNLTEAQRQAVCKKKKKTRHTPPGANVTVTKAHRPKLGEKNQATFHTKVLAPPDGACASLPSHLLSLRLQPILDGGRRKRCNSWRVSGEQNHHLPHIEDKKMQFTYCNL